MNEVLPTPPKDPALLTAWLARVPSHVAAAWVSSQQAKDRSSLCDDLFPENALKTLKARDDRFLDLALALYGDDDAVLCELWATSDPAIQRAIVCNQNRDRDRVRPEEVPGFLTPEGFRTFLAEADIADLKAFVTNPSLKGDNLSALFERTGYYAGLPSDRWRYVAVVALMNPNLHSEFREDRFAVDPYPIRRIEADRPKSLAFRLLFEVPAEQPWASELEDGYSRFPDLDPPIQSPKGIDLLTKEGQEELRTWRAQANREFLERAFERWTLKDEDKPRAQLVPEGSAGLRMVLASKVPSYNRDLRDWLEKHEDKWVRIGVATTKDFYTPEDVREWYERDGWAFLDAVSSNPSLHRRSKPAVVAEVRSLLVH